MTATAQTLARGEIVAAAAVITAGCPQDYGAYVIGVVVGINLAAMLAAVVVPHEHRQPPLPVGLVAVATGCRVRSDLVSLSTGRPEARRPVGWEPLGHQDLRETIPVVPVLFVVPETSLR